MAVIRSPTRRHASSAAAIAEAAVRVDIRRAAVIGARAVLVLWLVGVAHARRAGLAPAPQPRQGGDDPDRLLRGPVALGGDGGLRGGGPRRPEAPVPTSGRRRSGVHGTRRGPAPPRGNRLRGQLRLAGAVSAVGRRGRGGVGGGAALASKPHRASGLDRRGRLLGGLPGARGVPVGRARASRDQSTGGCRRPRSSASSRSRRTSRRCCPRNCWR